jgi:hypothetical protein
MLVVERANLFPHALLHILLDLKMSQKALASNQKACYQLRPPPQSRAAAANRRSNSSPPGHATVNLDLETFPRLR